MFANVGEIVTGMKLKKVYGPRVFIVLADYLDCQPRQKREKRKFRIIQPLPELEVYQVAERARFTHSFAEVVEYAFAEIEEVQGELEEWLEALPDALRDDDTGMRLQETIYTLAGVVDQQPDEIPELLCELPVYNPPTILDYTSRRDRIDDVMAGLVACELAANEYLAQVKASAAPAEARAITLADDLLEVLDNAVMDLDNTDFPGMYGA